MPRVFDKMRVHSTPNASRRSEPGAGPGRRGVHMPRGSPPLSGSSAWLGPASAHRSRPDRPRTAPAALEPRAAAAGTSSRPRWARRTWWYAAAGPSRGRRPSSALSPQHEGGQWLGLAQGVIVYADPAGKHVECCDISLINAGNCNIPRDVIWLFSE